VRSVLLALAATWLVVDVPSRHANAPPSESMAATLSAVAARRAPAARGRRRPPSGAGRDGGGVGSGVGGCSSMQRPYEGAVNRPVEAGKR
jgi:hypothetical protein